jgi:F0F1-type ATP synthase membrane subunit b/b'
MDIREYLGDMLLLAVLVVSTLVLVFNLRFDLINSIAAALMMLSIGGLIFLVHWKVRRIEKSLYNRERMIRVNLEEISTKMAQRYEASMAHVNSVVEEFAKRVYR